MGTSLLSPRGSNYNTKWGGRRDFYFYKLKIRVFHRFLSRTFPRARGSGGGPGALERLNSPLLNSPIWLIFLHCQARHVAGETSDFASIAPSGSNKRAFPRQQIKQRGRSALKGKYSNGWKNEEENGAAYRNRTDT